MTVSLSIKSVPADLARALRQQAERNHRSIQGELMHILEGAVGQRPFRAHELLEQIRATGVKTASDGTAIIRKDRDRR